MSEATTKMTVAEAGAKGGNARKESLTPEQRSKIARAAVEERWRKAGKREGSQQAAHSPSPDNQEPPGVSGTNPLHQEKTVSTSPDNPESPGASGANPKAPLGILDMLGLYGFNTLRERGKLVRHAENKYPVEELLRHGWLDLYQAYQGKPRFDDLDVIVSCYGLTGTRSCFYGVFKVLGRRPTSEVPVPASCPWVLDWLKKCPYFYDLERLPGYEPLERRLVIDWGKGLRTWNQHLSNKRVLELLPEGRRLPVFDDYMEFTLSYGELRELYQHQDAHHDWRARLEAVAGVYLILAEKTGNLYVGSACGAGGIWGRWEHYARTGHGGNKLLAELVSGDPDCYPNDFRFSLLQILPKTFTKDEVIKHEALYKQKLGTRAYGLNLN